MKDFAESRYPDEGCRDGPVQNTADDPLQTSVSPGVPYQDELRASRADDQPSTSEAKLVEFAGVLTNIDHRRA